MSVDKRLEQLTAAIDAHRVDADTALMEVENMADRQRTRHGILLAVAAAAVLVAGLVWGPGLLDSLGGESDPVPAGPAEDPAAVLAAYQEVRNVDPSGDADPDQWLDSLMSFYADDAVVTGHPFDTNDPPVATGRDEIGALEARLGPGFFNSNFSQRPAHATQYVEVEVSGNRATFRTHHFNLHGECSGGNAVDEITVQDGKITRYTWGDGATEPCDPDQLALIYPDGTSVEFTGDECIYSGPTQFSVGDQFNITAVDSTQQPSYEVGYSMLKVTDGATIADAEAQGYEALLDGDSGSYLYSLRAEEGTERFMSVTLDVPGTWLLHCFYFPGGQQVYASTLEVVE